MARFVIRPKTSSRTGTQARPMQELLRDVAPALADVGARLLTGVGQGSVSLSFSTFEPLAKVLDVAKGRARSLLVEGDRNLLHRFKNPSSAEIFAEEAIEFEKCVMTPFDLLRAPPLDLAETFRSAPIAAASPGAARRFTITVTGRQGRKSVPVPHAEIHVFVAAAGGVREHLEFRADAQGQCAVTLSSLYRVLAIFVHPYSEYWPVILRGDPGNRQVVPIACDQLNADQPGPAAWWHEAVSSNAQNALGRFATRSGSIRVGVVDSGCGPHPALAHVVNAGSFIDGMHDPSGGADSGSHGTHVCGTIVARNQGVNIPYQGVAPGLELVSARVFPDRGGANQGDIADAIDMLVEEHRVDLINMSLGSGEPSMILKDAIANALNQGCLCICAAGNDAGQVSYPAAFPDAIAVAAIGRLGMVPERSDPALPVSPLLYGSGGYHAASFTNFGPEIRLATPGVGIVAPVPARFGMAAPYAAMNGTSMASPVATAAIAAILANDAEYVTFNRDRERTRFVRNLLAGKCRSVELPLSHEGRGVPMIR